MKYLNTRQKLVIRKLLGWFVFCWIFSGLAYSQVLESIYPWSNLVAAVKGDHLRAMMTAYDDFSKSVSPEIARKEEIRYGKDSLPVYGAKIENYVIEIREGSAGYIVIFRLKKNDKLTQIMGSGGMTEYLIDAKTFKIIRIERGGK